jgi:DNA invertase Pin-like site-specific DNA recombinase
MRAAIYARVSTPRQARDLKIDQQVARLERYVQRKGWSLDRERVYLDEGYSGASLNRPGLDALRDAAAMAEFEVVVGTPRSSQSNAAGHATRRVRGSRSWCGKICARSSPIRSTPSTP